MKAVKVQYTVQPEYVETNKKNIKAVKDHLENNPINGMWYKAFLLEDGKSFMHINICDSQETMDKLNNVEEFKSFRMQLKESEPVSPPNVEQIEMM